MHLRVQNSENRSRYPARIDAEPETTRFGGPARLRGPAPGTGQTWKSGTPSPSFAVAYISYAGKGSINPLNEIVAADGSTELKFIEIVPLKSMSPMNCAPKTQGMCI